MKILSEIAKQKKKELVIQQDRLVDGILCAQEFSPFPTRISAAAVRCPACGGSEGMTCLLDAEDRDSKRGWICRGPVCWAKAMKKLEVATHTPPPSRCEILWPEFCEINGVGDGFMKATLSDLKKEAFIISRVNEFVDFKKRFMIFHGMPGTGKSFSALMMCREIIQKEPACMYFTHQRLLKTWTMHREVGDELDWLDRLGRCKVLVIDDFGKGGSTEGFMRVVFDLLDERLRWNNRYTLLVTNSTTEQLKKSLDTAMIDRLQNAQWVQFRGDSWRKG